jgi:hypothetical protein
MFGFAAFYAYESRKREAISRPICFVQTSRCQDAGAPKMHRGGLGCWVSSLALDMRN